MSKEVCDACGTEAMTLPPGLLYCFECERVVEGQTHKEDEDDAGNNRGSKTMAGRRH